MHPMDDSIAAIATAPGRAGLAVVRISGASAFAVADAVFRGRVRLAEAPSHTLHHGWAVWPRGGASAAAATGEARRIDEVVAGIFRAPRSYTREHSIEFSCHGAGSPP